jgi:hypothetical protein
MQTRNSGNPAVQPHTLTTFTSVSILSLGEHKLSEREPDQREIDQVEPEAYLPTEVPVKVIGPVRAQALPATAFATRTHDLTTTAVKVANRDMRRARMSFIADAEVWLGPNQTSAKENVGGRIPIDILVWHYHTAEVWAATATGTGAITVHQEFWTD